MSDKFRFSELFLNEFIENFSGIFYCFSVSEKRMIRLSDGCKEITGYNAEELINNPNLDFYDLVHPEDQQLVTDAWNAALNGKEYNIEHKIIVNGQEKWVREKAKVEFDADGQPLTGIGIVHDITKLKVLEKNLFSSIIETEEKEKERISAELHDGVYQELAGGG